MNENLEEMDLNEEFVFELVNNFIFKEVICGKTLEIFNDYFLVFEKVFAVLLFEVESDKFVLKETEIVRKVVFIIVFII